MLIERRSTSGILCLLMMESKMCKKRSFSLIELMVVIAIIGFLAGMMVVGYDKIFGDAAVDTTKATIQQTESALRMYKIKEKRYPSTDDGILTLVEKGYLEKPPLDAWNSQIQYIHPGTRSKPYDLYSYGEDGLEGGEGINSDIFNGE